MRDQTFNKLKNRRSSVHNHTWIMEGRRSKFKCVKCGVIKIVSTNTEYILLDGSTVFKSPDCK